MKNNKILRGLSVVFMSLQVIGILMTVLAFQWKGHINYFLNIEPPKIEGTDDTTYYKSDFGLNDEGLKKLIEESDRHDIQTMEEGAVLLKNDNNALPLKQNERNVTLFGRAVADPVYKGNSGGPSHDMKRLVTLYSGLKDVGFNINDTLFDAYKNSPTERLKPSVENNLGQKASIGEEHISFYSNSLKASFEEEYNDVAIVMFARDAGEGKDLFYNDIDGVSQLSLHQQEADLLRMIKESNKFEKTIVLINSAYAMEMDWVDSDEFGVDSVLWIGNPGLKGFAGVANLLIGKADPSGRLVDTFAADSLSSAAVQNAFSIPILNMDKHIIVEAENVYVGYKYYETRYQDQVLGINNATSNAGSFASGLTGWDYAKEMNYTFGYGQSYADFSQEIINLKWDKLTQKVTASVKVTNNGYPEGSAYTGKSKTAVQLYVQLPYETGQSEKSAIQLIDFEKTPLLGKGESATVEFEVDDYIFASYDNKIENGADTSKKGAYVFDQGDYHFAIGTDAHDALNNVLSFRKSNEIGLTVGNLFDHKGRIVEGDKDKVIKVNLDKTDNVTYAKSRETGKIVSNLFDQIDLNYFYEEDVVTYLTRDDWNTFPKKYDNITATDVMIANVKNNKYQKPAKGPNYDSFTQGVDSNIKLVEMMDVEFDDPLWETFLNQLTIAELSLIVGEAFGQPAIKSIGKPANFNSDGPDGAQGNYKYGDKSIATQHVNEIVAAQTWNKELLEERGNIIAEDAMFVRTSQLWSPGANIHRTPFSGRNFEYYSEDAVFSYIASAHQTKAMQAKGLNASIKHFAGNNQETNRNSILLFSSEQGFRQNSLKGFEGAFRIGGALGTMLSMGSIGTTADLYVDQVLLTNLLRDEWGFKGLTITDSVAGQTQVETITALVAGVDTFNADSGRASIVQKHIVANKDGYVLDALRTANKRFYYGMVRSNMMNGVGIDTVVANFVPWWQKALVGILIGNGIVTVGITGTYIYVSYFRRREDEKHG